MTWSDAKANAARVVVAPGKKFLTETAYHADGSRTVRIQSHGDGYVTVNTYRSTMVDAGLLT